MNKHFHLHWQVAILILVTCLPIYSQRQTRQRRDTEQQKSQQEARDLEQRRLDEEAVKQMPDSGADLAFVVAEQADIHEESVASSKVLLAVKRGDVLALIERQPVDHWYKVIHIDSATEGWVDELSVIAKFTAKRENAPPLDKEYVGGDSDPQLSVTNLEPETDLNLRINGDKYVVRAGTTKTFNLKPGKYNYYGWSPGVGPAIGADDLRSGVRYSWTFKIIRHKG